ncbi:hypothetical protein PGTUg99_010527 [Puccinia graminis f. sp. tritici]|uniref:Uncharacterized protein n=1 Tax=Puccinia graminis f. sp. tritici TaxID=56615 RepID=A0A5B0RAS6_PUCGR|nr:hypothetical protein PGTUg99_010527 [Puccinia graminis f. sp. tritici]
MRVTCAPPPSRKSATNFRVAVFKCLRKVCGTRVPTRTPQIRKNPVYPRTGSAFGIGLGRSGIRSDAENPQISGVLTGNSLHGAGYPPGSAAGGVKPGSEAPGRNPSLCRDTCE